MCVISKFVFKCLPKSLKYSLKSDENSLKIDDFSILTLHHCQGIMYHGVSLDTANRLNELMERRGIVGF